MNRVLVVCFMIFVSHLALAREEMKIEGSCKGVYGETNISFTYYSTFDGCQNTSKASIKIKSAQIPKANGIRDLSDGQDKYTFSIKQAGQLKAIYWLDFPDTTGIKQGLFKYHDVAGILQSVLLECSTYDYEYSECL